MRPNRARPERAPGQEDAGRLPLGDGRTLTAPVRVAADDFAGRLRGDERGVPRAEAGIEEARLEEAAEPSERVTPYSLRRTYASLRAASGDEAVYTAEQMGHQDFAFTYRVYQRAVKRRGKLSGAHLREFDRALEWAAIGQQANASPSEAPTTSEAEIPDPASPSHNHHAGR